jgi:hypothetical protein
MEAYYDNFEQNNQELRSFCNTIIKSHPPGFFTYYYLYPEFRNLPSEQLVIDDDLKYFGKDDEGSYRWNRRRRVAKEMQKAREMKELNHHDHVSTSLKDTLPHRQCTK